MCFSLVKVMRNMKCRKYDQSLSFGNVKKYLKLQSTSAKEYKHIDSYRIVDVL